MQRWDWKDTEEESFCRAPHNNDSEGKVPILNVVHFVLLSDKAEKLDLDYARFLAFKPAIVRAEAKKIKLHSTGLNEQNY